MDVFLTLDIYGKYKRKTTARYDINPICSHVSTNYTLKAFLEDCSSQRHYIKDQVLLFFQENNIRDGLSSPKWNRYDKPEHST